MGNIKSSSACDRGYNALWQRTRLRYLRDHPLCVMCTAHGEITAATVVDHIVPHRGDMDLFWDEANWQSLCKPHHDGAKRRQDITGKLPGCDVDGNPLDCNRKWK